MATLNDYIGMYDKIFADIGGPVAQFYQSWREQMLSTSKKQTTAPELAQPQPFDSPFAPKEEQQPQAPFSTPQEPAPFKPSDNPTGQYFPILNQVAQSQNSLFQTLNSTPQLGSGM